MSFFEIVVLDTSMIAEIFSSGLSFERRKGEGKNVKNCEIVYDILSGSKDYYMYMHTKIKP